MDGVVLMGNPRWKARAFAPALFSQLLQLSWLRE